MENKFGLNLNRFQLDNLRRISQGVPRPIIYGAPPTANESEYTFFLRNNSTETIPANTFISAALVWDIEDWTIYYNDETYTGTDGLFGTPWSSEWSPSNSPYDQLLYNVLTNKECYLRFNDWFANPGQHGVPAWLEETWGNMYARPNIATGLGTTKWGWSKESPINAPGRFYCKTAIDPNTQGQIYFVDDVRPVYYAQADAANSASFLSGVSPLNRRNEKNQHFLRGSRFGARYIPRFLNNTGVISQFWKYPDGEFTGSAQLGPTSSYTSWVQDFCEFDISYGLSSQLLIASIPAPIVENTGVSTTSDYTDITDFWTQDVLISNSRIVYNDPYLWAGYRGASQSTSNKSFPARVLGLACACYNFTSPFGGFFYGTTTTGVTGSVADGPGQIYHPGETSGYCGSFCCGKYGGVFNVAPSFSNYWGPSSGETDAVYFRPIASPVIRSVSSQLEPDSNRRIWLQPVYGSTRFIEKLDNAASGGYDYLRGTLLDSSYNITTTAAGDGVWVVCNSMGSTGGGETHYFTMPNGDRYWPLIIKNVNERYSIF